MRNFTRIMMIILLALLPVSAQATWIQYDATTGAQRATNSQKVSDAALALVGAAQIEYTGNADPTTKMVDVTQNPPAIVDAPPPAPPPASEIDLIFNAMVQSGQIDPGTVDPVLLSRVNSSLAVSGAATIAAPANSKVTTSVR